MVDCFGARQYTNLAMEDWVLIVIVIVVIYLFASGKGRKLLGFGPKPVDSTPADALPSADPATAQRIPADVATLSGEAKKEALEQKLITEGIAGTNGGDSMCSGDLSFAQNDFGVAGIEFTDWAMLQTLDPRIVASNQQFVADRLGNPQTWTGATYSPDRHDSYDAVPWRGLSRPARVATYSPDQVPDIDTGRNPVVKKFRWDSSETE